MAGDGGHAVGVRSSFAARASRVSLAQPVVIESSGCGSFKWARETIDEAVTEIERLIKAKLDELKWANRYQ